MSMIAPSLRNLLSAAQQDMAAARWPAAKAGFLAALPLAPQAPQLHHNLALCQLATGESQQAQKSAEHALVLEPKLWQSHIVLGSALKHLKRYEEADASFVQGLRAQPNHAEAVLARADMAINIFGLPLQAVEWAKPLLSDPLSAPDAELTTLMASVYDRDVSAASLSQSVKFFSKRHMRLKPDFLADLGTIEPRKFWEAAKGGHRPRVGLISPLFCASPVYFLTIAGWRHVAKGCDIVVFHRGSKSDWATEQFKSLSREWRDVADHSAEALARQIHDADIDVLYDLGGWMDPVALKALSAKPARVMYKWVGGQSLTTGLESFDGWIGDAWQSPATLQHLYSEPLINIPGGYATYTAPPYMPAPSTRKSSVPVIFSNPAKLSRSFLAWLAQIDGPKLFVHRQFKYERTRHKVLQAMGKTVVQFICPGSHREALEILGRHEWMIDTFPYSSGLTAREAAAMGMKVKTFTGELFCERHSLHLASS